MADRTRELTEQMIIATHVLPAEADLRAYLDACTRDATVAPIFTPSAWMQGRERFEALEKLARATLRAAVDMRAALKDLQEATGREADPEMDAAAQALLQAFRRRHGGRGQPHA